MDLIREKAWAKLNLSLDVTGKRPDGYHEVRMVMQSVTLCDDVTVRLTDDGSFGAKTNRGFIPGDDRNEAVKAARVFAEECGLDGKGVFVDIFKRTPVRAGLGGGSSDAAAVLRGLNILRGRPLDGEQLEQLAAQVGSDVAFCVRGGTQLASGRGEVLTPLTELGRHWVVICKPYFSISTPALFQKIDARKSKCRPDTDGMIAALDAGDAMGVVRRMYNVFEDVLGDKARGIREIKSALVDRGALGACMTGTGSAVFGVFPDEKSAKNACFALRKRHPEVFWCETRGAVEI